MSEIRIKVIESQPTTPIPQVERYYTLDEIKEIFDGDPNCIVMGLVREIEALRKPAEPTQPRIVGKVEREEMYQGRTHNKHIPLNCNTNKLLDTIEAVVEALDTALNDFVSEDWHSPAICKFRRRIDVLQKRLDEGDGGGK